MQAKQFLLVIQVGNFSWYAKDIVRNGDCPVTEDRSKAHRFSARTVKKHAEALKNIDQSRIKIIED